jgi:hypothetical protein
MLRRINFILNIQKDRGILSIKGIMVEIERDYLSEVPPGRYFINRRCSEAQPTDERGIASFQVPAGRYFVVEYHLDKQNKIFINS